MPSVSASVQEWKEILASPNQLDFYFQVNSLQSLVNGLLQWKPTEGLASCEMAVQQ